MSVKQITSLKNDNIKRVIALNTGGKRRKFGLFPIEGRKEIAHAFNSGLDICEVYLCPEVLADDEALSGYPGMLDAISSSVEQIFEVPSHIYNKIAYRKNVEGIYAVARYPAKQPDIAALPENPLILVIEGVEKPGNLGAMLRTADGAGVDMVLVADNGGTDLYNPNAIRSSLGSIFTLNVFCLPLSDVIALLKDSGVQIVLTSPAATKSLWEVDYCRGTAVVLGSEHTGLPEEWLQEEKNSVYIPMAGKMDSLNVSCSGAIMLYEARRQRRIKN